MTLGIEDKIIPDRFIVYPNPTTGQINIVTDENIFNENFEIKLFNLQGQLIKEIKNELSPIQLLAAGVYILEINIGQEKYYKKIIRE